MEAEAATAHPKVNPLTAAATRRARVLAGENSASRATVRGKAPPILAPVMKRSTQKAG